jgi:hypothetical protein
MTVQSAVYDTGYILWKKNSIDNALFILIIKTIAHELQYLLPQSWGYVPENHNAVRNQRIT